MFRSQSSSKKVTKASRNVACPSKTPNKALKYTDNKCTILDPQGCPMASLKLMDVAKGERSMMPKVGKCKDSGSKGASVPL